MRPEYVPKALEQMDNWLKTFTDQLPDPERVPIENGDFRWRFPDETNGDVEVLLVCKSVRMVSALSAAWQLAKMGYGTEAGALLRLVQDFSSEIYFMAEAVIEGRETTSQKKFRKQFFKPMPQNVEEFLARERDYYISRRDVATARRKLARQSGLSQDLLEEMDASSRFLSFGLNAYVHGDYETAMELYHGGDKQFRVNGLGEEARASHVRFVALKSTEALQALEMVALLFGLNTTIREIQTFLVNADPSIRDVRLGD